LFNGIGKSTLLRTITAIQKPISGEVFLNEKNIFTIENSDLAQQQSLVLTDKLPSSNLSVWELIALGRQPYTNWIGTLSEEDFNKITTAIQLTNIEHLIEKKHHEISDGQLQKVLIARALAQDTDLIILDDGVFTNFGEYISPIATNLDEVTTYSKFVSNINVVSNIPYDIVHNLDSEDIVVSIYNNGSLYNTDVLIVDTNTISITSAISASLKVNIIS
jgi:ABC-type thiamine transport system ATPase subunit